MARVGRRTKYDEPLDERVVTYFTKTQVDELIEFVGTKDDLGPLLRDLALKHMARQRAGETESELTPMEGGGAELRLELPGDTVARLSDLAPKFHMRDAAGYAEWLLNASSDKSKKQVLAFVFSEENAQSDSSHNENDENGASENNPSPKPKRAKKVA